MVGMACERRIFTSTYGDLVLYPNLFVSLVGVPGSGKTIPIDKVKDILRAVGKLKIAPDTCSRQGLTDEIAKSVNSATINGKLVQYCSLQICSNELSSLIPAYDVDFLGQLSNLYDCPKLFEETLRTREPPTLSIVNPQLSFLAAGQPNYLAAVMPDLAWGQGFLTRNIMVYCPGIILQPMFQKTPRQDFLSMCIEDDIKHLSELIGGIRWDKDAEDAINAWHMAGGPPRPNHPKLNYYNSRRPIHVAKLCMILSLAEGDSFRITKSHVDKAIGLLLEAEVTMLGVFRDVMQGGDEAVLWDAWTHLTDIHAKTNKPIPHRTVVRFLSSRVKNQQILPTIETLIQAKMLSKVGGPDVREPNYLPLKHEA